MRVVECDPNCHYRSGCSERGQGKCDKSCKTGFGLDPDTYTCMSECHLILVSIHVGCFGSRVVNGLSMINTLIAIFVIHGQ